MSAMYLHAHWVYRSDFFRVDPTTHLLYILQIESLSEMYYIDHLLISVSYSHTDPVGYSNQLNRSTTGRDAPYMYLQDAKNRMELC